MLNAIKSTFQALFEGTADTQSLDGQINTIVQPLTDALSSVVFFSVKVLGADVPLIVVWLIAGAIFFTLYFGFINLRGLGHALWLANPFRAKTGEPGEVSHFQALAVAISGTVGIGNIGGVAITLSLGGPGATFWLIFAGLVGMTTKFVECTLGVKYREIGADGTVVGGPMYYLQKGLTDRGLPGLGRGLGLFFSVAIVIGCMGIGNMFQSNQAAEQLAALTGGDTGALADKGWIVGLGMSVLVGLVIIGGIRSIARITEKLVPFMVLIYLAGSLFVILTHITALPAALLAIIEGAFSPQGMAGGAIGVMILGFQRAAFSNEAGLGSASIAHAAVQTKEPVTEGFVALLEPFIDTVIICTLTALVLVLTLPEETITGGGLVGIELTTSAFETTITGSSYVLSVVAFLFALSTMIAWAYYGQRGWIYLFGRNKSILHLFNFVFCAFIIVGATIELDAVLNFADAMIYLMALPNIAGLYFMAPEVKRDLEAYLARLRNSSATG